MMKMYSMLMIGCLFISCKNQAGKGKKLKQDTVPLFTVGKPDETWSLPDELQEISGISWIDANHLMAIEDLHASLYILAVDKNNIIIEKTISFKEDKDKKFDVEDVALDGNAAYTIWSHGAIFEIDNWAKQPLTTEYATGLTKADNAEGICFDDSTGNLLVACKGPGENEGEKKSTRAVYIFNIKDKKLISAPLFLIKKQAFKDKLQTEVDFNPSAISIDPVSNNVFILSTRGTKCLASFDRKGVLLTFQYLDPAVFPQPEGLCFSPDGTLYISSEGKTTPGVICKFKRAK